VSHTASPTFLRELDKKLWTAADKLRSNLDDFKAVYHPGAFAKRKETERFKKFTYVEIVESLEAALEEFRAVEEALASSAE
jgi:hypothetical protein